MPKFEVSVIGRYWVEADNAEAAWMKVCKHTEQNYDDGSVKIIDTVQELVRELPVETTADDLI